MTSGEEYVREADRSLRTAYEEPMSLAAYVEAALERPSIAAHASKYLLDAIESMGTRTVTEGGEEMERYRFFDDPANDGEHAVLGNTDALNGLVDDLRSIAAGRGGTGTMLWISGPTATGKSEFKRCLIGGLTAYSKTPEGRRYTLEWNVAPSESRGLSYGDRADGEEGDWHPSPVQANPLTVFPPDVREDLLADLDRRAGEGIPVRVDGRLDPFSREAYRRLEERYRRQGKGDLFSRITDERHLRVKNYVVEPGRGIGVLHAEDAGTPKERLVGTWMPEMLRELDSRGRKNPQAFSYDGVLSQGNAGVTVVEDAAQHADLLRKLLNVPEEGTVKLDKGVGMDVDTQLVLVSNPDLEAQLNQHAGRKGQDPLKALKRRLSKHSFRYLTDLSLEVELLRRELFDERGVPTAGAEGSGRVREPVVTTVPDGGGAAEREFAPHAIEAAALYEVVTRLDPEALPSGIDLVDEALLLDRGHLLVDGERVGVEEFDFEGGNDGETGIPVTYTRDALADLLVAERDRSHPDLAVERVVTPRDVLDAMVEGLGDAPVFSGGERGEYENRVHPVREYVLERQEADVLDAMLAAHRAEEETVEEYVEHVYAWATDGGVEAGPGSVDPDPLAMKVFEIEHLGRFDEDDYDGLEPTGTVESFRRQRVVSALNRQAWERRDEGFEVGDVDVTALPVIGDVLEASDWSDVERAFGDFDPRQWADPPAGTQTARVKAETIERLEGRGYSPASAELTTRRVMEEVSDRWV